MMKFNNIIAFLFLTLGVTTWGQKVKKIIKTTPNGTSEYYVLKSNKKIKHGEFKEIGLWPKTILEAGQYSNGKKDGLWTERYYSTNTLKAQGFYKLGERVGIWNFYGYKVTGVFQKYDYDSKKLIMSKECNTEVLYDVLIDNKLTKTKLDCPPSYLGSNNLLISILLRKFNDSLSSKNNNKKADLDIGDMVSILIKTDGTIGDVKVTNTKADKDFKIFLEKELEKNNNLWINNWLPAELDNKKLDAYLNIRIYTTISFKHNRQ